jgi:hypothetical protein
MTARNRRDKIIRRVMFKCARVNVVRVYKLIFETCNKASRNEYSEQTQSQGTTHRDCS